MPLVTVLRTRRATSSLLSRGPAAESVTPVGLREADRTTTTPPPPPLPELAPPLAVISTAPVTFTERPATMTTPPPAPPLSDVVLPPPLRRRRSRRASWWRSHLNRGYGLRPGPSHRPIPQSLRLNGASPITSHGLFAGRTRVVLAIHAVSARSESTSTAYTLMGSDFPFRSSSPCGWTAMSSPRPRHV